MIELGPELVVVFIDHDNASKNNSSSEIDISPVDLQKCLQLYFRSSFINGDIIEHRTMR